MPKNPLISVIIPLYNNELYIKEAIESVLIQKYEPLEIIVVDDGSTDNSAIIAKRFTTVKYIYQDNSNPSSARNTGLRHSKGEYVTFLDSDDVFASIFFSDFSYSLQMNSGVDIIEGRFQFLKQTKKVTEFEKKGDLHYHCLLGCSLFRKTVFDKIGTFNEQLTFGEDADWFMRAWENGIIKTRNSALAIYYRKHQTNLTNNTEQKNQSKTLLFKLKLERKKKGLSEHDRNESLKEYLGDVIKKENLSL